MKTIIEMAREAELLGPEDTEHDIIEYGLELWISGESGMQTLERFAELIRADAIADEREAVLDLVDDYAKGNTDLRDAIRARGNK